MIKKNVRLTNVRPYQDDCNKWFLELTYDYDANDGKHKLIVPKVTLPFANTRFPNFTSVKNDICGFYGENICTIEVIGHSRLSDARVFNGVVTDPRDGGLLDACMYADILVEPKVCEMTLDEIEKKLGYKVKIVSDKDGK